MIALYDLVDLGHKISEAHGSAFGSVSIGYGLWITAIASIGIVVGSLMTASAVQAAEPRTVRQRAALVRRR